MDGLLVEVAVSTPGACPVADASTTTGRPASDVRWTRRDDTVVEEFALAGTPAETDDGATGDGVPEERVASGAEGSVYRFERDPTDPCACDVAEAAGQPVRSVRTDADGTLRFTVHVADRDEVRSLVDRLEDHFDGVRVARLQSAGDADGSDPTVVDRARLTARQREVLETALDAGYFRYPRDADAGEAAEALGIARSTFSEHLAAALSTVLDDVFDE